MEIKYEFLTFDVKNWSVVVRFFADGLEQDIVFNVDVPFEDGAFMDEVRFKAYVDTMRPVQHFARIVAAQSATVPEYLAALPVVVTSSVDANDIGVTVL